MRQITVAVRPSASQSETGTRLPELKIRVPVLTPKFPFPPIIPEAELPDVRGFVQDEPADGAEEQEITDVEGYALWIYGAAVAIGAAAAGFGAGSAIYDAAYTAGAQANMQGAKKGIGYHAGYAAGKAAGKAGAGYN